MNIADYQIKRNTNAVRNATIGKSFFDTDLLFEDLSDLVSKDFRAWYCKVFYKLGRDKVMLLASQARADGKDKQKLFSYLLRKELGE